MRLYVRHKTESGEWRRGVVFLKEILPRFAISWVANTIYGEPYQTRRMRHSWIEKKGEVSANYEWKSAQWNSFSVNANLQSHELKINSETEFITEHFRGFTKLKHQKMATYEVEHPRWLTYPVLDFCVNVDFTEVYRNDFECLSNQNPSSVFLAEGSEIIVNTGHIIPTI